MFHVNMSWLNSTARSPRPVSSLSVCSLVKGSLSTRLLNPDTWEPFLQSARLRTATYSPPPYSIDSNSQDCVPHLLTSLHLHDDHPNESRHHLSRGPLHFPSSWALCTPEPLSIHAAQRCQSGLKMWIGARALR